MHRFSAFSLKNPVVVMTAAILALVGGLYYGGQLKRETMPDVAIPIVAVITPYPGAAPADVQSDVTEPLEQAIAEISGIKQTSGMSNDSVSVVIGQFSYSADMDEAEAEVEKAIADVELPDTAMDSMTSRVSMGSQPILRFAVAGGATAEELQRAVQDTLVPAIESVEGVGEVSVSNEIDDKVRIVFDAEKLEDAGLTAQGAVQQLQAANISFPVGSVEIGKIDQPIRVSGGFQNVKDIEDFEVAVYPDQGEMMADAFKSIGDGMSALGGAVAGIGRGMGGLAAGMGQGFSALGEGMGQLGQTSGELAMQAGLINGIQQLQAQMYALKYDTLPQLKSMASSLPTSTPEYAQLQAQISQIESVTVPGMQQAVDSMQAQIAGSQQRLAAQAGSAPAIPQGGAGASMPSGSGMSMPSSSGEAGMPDPKIDVVRLGDVAKVTFGTEEDQVFSRANGEPAVLMTVVKTQDANTVDVSKAVHATIDDTLAELPKGTAVEYTYDGAVMIENSINDMLQEGLLGALFAFIVILVFLANIRSTLIAAISIPLSVVLALLFMHFAGVTMNVMTLGGLTVAIGRVVDDSIVVIENIYNHLQQGWERETGLIQRATTEVASAITSSTLTTVAVFMPMMLVSGIVGKIFIPFALTVAVALLSSLLVSLTIVPLLAKWSLLGARVRPRDDQATRTGKLYRRSLAWALDHPGPVVAIAVVMFVASVALIPVIGMGFMPPSTEKYIDVEVAYPAGSTAADVDRALGVLEQLARRGDIEFYTATVETKSGFAMSSGLTGGNKGRVFYKLKHDADVDRLLAEIQKAAEPIRAEGGKITASPVSMAGGSENLVEIVVTGPKAGIETAVASIGQALRGVEGLSNVDSNLSETRPQITADIDQAAAASYGLNAAMVAGTIRGYVAEQSAGSTQIKGRDAEIVYLTALDKVASAKDIAARKLTTPLGEEIKVGDIATVSETATPVSILTQDGKEYAAVSGSVTVRDTSSVIQEIQKAVDGLTLPEGVEIEIAGVAQMMSESFTQLGMAMLIAIAAVYLVMVVTFGEGTAPLAIMFSLPLAVIGGVVGLLIAGIPVDMPAMIGALMLIGIVTTNAIMFVERVHQRLDEGFERREALLDAGANRMRPILMTALTTIIALVPMAVGLKAGALMSQSLAIVVACGLATSTMLTLIVVPVIYNLLETLKERVLDRLSRQESLPAEV